MKVIKQGTNPATTPVQAVCSNCSAQVEFMPNEAKMNYDQRDGNFYSLSWPMLRPFDYERRALWLLGAGLISCIDIN